jgi:hypothetical protein
VSDQAKAAPAKSTPANDDRKPARTGQPGRRYADVPEVSEEEHRVGRPRGCDEGFKRKIAVKLR